MAASEDRIKQMFEENLGRPANPDVSAADSGVSSLDAVAFIKAVGESFNVSIPPADAAKFATLRDLINYVDSHTG
ncbi:MAG: phosphopantetheine-binding protein [Deltaproteobacteria bacterium]|nr:phosphopantetheine-binding protein [Deltaproteobacteria bacterium]